MVSQQPVINNYLAMFVLQDFSVMAVHCAVTSKQNHETFNWQIIATPEQENAEIVMSGSVP
jgi:hypothetical protein